MHEAFTPWVDWTLETADAWFVKPFDRRRKEPNENVDATSDENEGKSSDIVPPTSSNIDISNINTSIDVTGDRNDSVPEKSAEV